MVATVSPAGSSVEETLSTLRYAAQARSIVTAARVNEDLSAGLIRGERLGLEGRWAGVSSHSLTSVVKKAVLEPRLFLSGWLQQRLVTFPEGRRRARREQAGGAGDGAGRGALGAAAPRPQRRSPRFPSPASLPPRLDGAWRPRVRAGSRSVFPPLHLLSSTSGAISIKRRSSEFQLGKPLISVPSPYGYGVPGQGWFAPVVPDGCPVPSGALCWRIHFVAILLRGRDSLTGERFFRLRLGRDL